MAPNLNRNALFAATQVSGLSPQLAVRSATSKDYQPRPPVVDSDSYWAWPSNADSCFSADHLTANLVAAAASSSSSSLPSSTTETTNPEHDAYWAEYQAEPQHKESSRSAAAPAKTAALPPQPAAVTNNNPAKNYWDEAPHVRTERDAYWLEQESAAPTRRCSCPKNYWDETDYAVPRAAVSYWVGC